MKRISFIDIARAIAIILIVFGHTIVHSSNCGIIFKLIYSFHVALFFIISGYVYKNKNNNYFDFIKNKFIRIMIPYFIWGLLFLIPYFLFGSDVASEVGVNSSFSIKQMLLNVLYGVGYNNALKQNSALWFLPALFSMELVYYWIIKLSDKINNIYKVLILIVLLIITIICNYYLKFILPFGINTVLTMGIYFYIGYLLNNFDLLNNKKLFKCYYMIIIFIIGFICAWFNGSVQPIEYEYSNIFLSLGSGIGLSLVVIYLSYIIKENKILCYIGKSTMEILIFHKLLVVIFQTKLGIISSLMTNSNIFIELGISIVVVILSIAISLLGGYIISKICPIVIGKRKSSLSK